MGEINPDIIDRKQSSLDKACQIEHEHHLRRLDTLLDDMKAFFAKMGWPWPSLRCVYRDSCGKNCEDPESCDHYRAELPEEDWRCR